MAELAPTRIAVWGIGYHARKNVLPAIAACDRVTLAGVYSRNQKEAREATAGSGVPVWPSPDAMLSSLDVDAVYLCTPIGLHHEQGLSVIQAGKHLLGEKALTARAVDSMNLIDEARARDLALCEAFMYAFHPQFRRLAELIESPECGGIETLGCWFGMPKLDHPGFRQDRELGGGGFLDLACYPISLAARLLHGVPRVMSISIGTIDGVDVDMTGHTTLEFPEGATAHLEWGFGRAYRNEVSVWCANRTLFADRIFSKPADYTSHIEVRDQRGAEEIIEIPPANAFASMLHEFATATREPKTREGLRVIAMRQAEIVGSLETAIRENPGS